jgi:cation diffusion facilitator CzcD-associated flavoprotein CzcO/acetyl esterase/lipase
VAHPEDEVDVVVVGAGFAGLYLLYRLRQLGFSAVGIDAAGDVGGTWYWNRYPGARCDIPTTDYTYSFDPDLEEEWTWSEKYATQPEILEYLGLVADRYQLRPLIRFNTRMEAARWHDGDRGWDVRTDAGDSVRCRYLVMASGCLSLPKTPDIAGFERFAGEVYFTGRWPHQPVDFSGKRVAVIGTGSSAIQSIPLIARQAAQLTVLQRTANFSIPAHNGPPSEERLAMLAKDRATYRHEARHSPGGIPGERTLITGAMASDEVRRERFEAAWEEGELFGILGVFADQGFNPETNEVVAEMIRERIREIVDDPQTAEDLCPRGHYLGTKRPCLDTGYFATYNRPNVRLINLRRDPITTITEVGIDTASESMPFDAIVFATGFDAMTGPLVSVDVVGVDGITLEQRWAGGPETYLGLTTVGFPNFFTVTGPGSPSVLSNMAVSIEQHVEWISDCLADLREQGFDRIEPTQMAEAAWGQHVQDCAAITLHPTADSWYMGANVPGKPRVMLPYIGGVDAYRSACEDVVSGGYLGFALSGPGRSQCNDGVVRRLQPDVKFVLEMMAELGMPPLESMDAAGARAFMTASAAVRPPGRPVGEIVDGTLPGAAGPLGYRLYRPASPGPHPVVVYFHGGGWVLGDLDSDDPLCRDLCRRSDCVVLSVNYRHAPEAVFPAAADDAFSAVQWVAANADSLGCDPERLAVAGWSAGGNIATVACQLARDAGGPAIAGQVLLTPVTDSDMTRGSYEENGEGYVLTSALMRWFWDHYATPEQRRDPKAAPLGGDLAGLPPALVVTSEFDPLRDEGIAYVEALQRAGVAAEHVNARGHTHTSVPMVDVILSGAPIRAQMTDALRRMLGQPPA